MADLDAAGLATFQEFHATYYAPNNAVLTVVGDVAPGEVFILAEKYFGGLSPRVDIPLAPDGRARIVPQGPVAETVVGDVPAPRVYLAHRTYPFGSGEYDAVTLLAVILGDGRGSRLYQRLADGARLAQPDNVAAYGVDLAHAPAPLIITASARPGVSVERLTAGLFEVVDELTLGLPAHRVTEAELERAKALLTTAWWRAVSTVGGRADLLGRYATQFGDPALAGGRLPAWLAVTTDQVNEVAARVLRPEERVLLTYLPDEEQA
jgi:predicted Zn-dependent peptidase